MMGGEGEEEGFDLTCVADSSEIIRVKFYRAHIWLPIERPHYGVQLRYIYKLDSNLQLNTISICWGLVDSTC